MSNRVDESASLAQDKVLLSILIVFFQAWLVKTKVLGRGLGQKHGCPQINCIFLDTHHLENVFYGSFCLLLSIFGEDDSGFTVVQLLPRPVAVFFQTFQQSRCIFSSGFREQDDIISVHNAGNSCSVDAGFDSMDILFDEIHDMSLHNE